MFVYGGASVNITQKHLVLKFYLAGIFQYIPLWWRERITPNRPRIRAYAENILTSRSHDINDMFCIILDARLFKRAHTQSHTHTISPTYYNTVIILCVFIRTGNIVKAQWDVKRKCFELKIKCSCAWNHIILYWYGRYFIMPCLNRLRAHDTMETFDVSQISLVCIVSIWKSLY